MKFAVNYCHVSASLPGINGGRYASHSPQRGPVTQPARFPTPETPDPMNLDHELLDEASEPEQVPGRPQAKSSRMRGLPESPLPAILGAMVVLLLGFALTQTNDRISRLEDRVDAGFTRVDAGFARVDEQFARVDEQFVRVDGQFARVDEQFARVDEQFARVDERLVALDAKLDELDRKLTALIAGINATEEVEAALEGRLLNPEAPPVDEPIPQSG
ncbi:MAG: hypothetical protein F4X52_10355 [Acidimicrobiaceae bacterium]|nr:hypothetical protein [Acidimicrobiaceae bacterium]